MKIDNRIIHYEISKQLPKRPENEIEGTGEKQTSNEQKVEEKNQEVENNLKAGEEKIFNTVFE